MQIVFWWFMVILSSLRQAFFPSIFTSNEKRMNFASFMLVLDTTPPAVPASSPLQVAYSQSFTAIICPPSAFTVVVPFLRSLDLDRMTG